MPTVTSRIAGSTSDDDVAELHEAVVAAQATGTETFQALADRIASANQAVAAEWVAVQEHVAAELSEVGKVPAVSECQRRYEELVAASLVASDGSGGDRLEAAARAYQSALAEVGRAVASALDDVYARHGERLTALTESVNASLLAVADAVDDYHRGLATTWQQLIEQQQTIRRRTVTAAAGAAPATRKSKPAKRAATADDSMLWPGAGDQADVANPDTNSDH